jgi:hypothetical protein
MFSIPEDLMIYEFEDEKEESPSSIVDFTNSTLSTHYNCLQMTKHARKFSDQAKINNKLVSKDKEEVKERVGERI